jgi:hypothetical protein
MNARSCCIVSAVISALAAVAHAARLSRHRPLQRGMAVIAPQASWIGLAFAAQPCVRGLRSARR